MKWYYEEWEQSIGPFEEKEMKKFIKQGKIRKNTYVKSEKMEDWKRAVETDLQAYFDELNPDEEKRENFRWYYKKGGTTIGPFTETEIAKKIKSKEINDSTLVKQLNSDEWNNIMDTYLHNYFVEEE
jgi:hypothetical protein